MVYGYICVLHFLIHSSFRPFFIANALWWQRVGATFRVVLLWSFPKSQFVSDGLFVCLVSLGTEPHTTSKYILDRKKIRLSQSLFRLLASFDSCLQRILEWYIFLAIQKYFKVVWPQCGSIFFTNQMILSENLASIISVHY